MIFALKRAECLPGCDDVVWTVMVVFLSVLALGIFGAAWICLIMEGRERRRAERDADDER